MSLLPPVVIFCLALRLDTFPMLPESVLGVPYPLQVSSGRGVGRGEHRVIEVLHCSPGLIFLAAFLANIPTLRA